MGFQFGNPVVGGTVLIRPAIQSPDYAPGETGWIVKSDGSVEFNNGTFRGTVSGGTLIISQGSGATFEEIEIDGATGITTWSKYQSPTVVIRQILANGTDLIYADPGSGNPQGALIQSVSAVPGTDQGNNAYLAGNVSYAESEADIWTAAQVGIAGGEAGAGVSFYTAASPAGPWTLQSVVFGANTGVLRIINGEDGGTYTPGHLLLTATGTTVNKVTPIPLDGLSTFVGPGTYKVSGSIRVVAAASGTAQAFRIQFNGTGTALSGCRIRTRAYHEASGVTVNTGTISGLSSSGADTGAMANGAVYSVDFEGPITVSAAGTFHVDGLQATSASDETFDVQALSWMELVPA